MLNKQRSVSGEHVVLHLARFLFLCSTFKGEDHIQHLIFQIPVTLFIKTIKGTVELQHAVLQTCQTSGRDSSRRYRNINGGFGRQASQPLLKSDFDEMATSQDRRSCSYLLCHRRHPPFAPLSLASLSLTYTHTHTTSVGFFGPLHCTRYHQRTPRG